MLNCTVANIPSLILHLFSALLFISCKIVCSCRWFTSGLVTFDRKAKVEERRMEWF